MCVYMAQQGNAYSLKGSSVIISLGTSKYPLSLSPSPPVPISVVLISEVSCTSASLAKFIIIRGRLSLVLMNIHEMRMPIWDCFLVQSSAQVSWVEKARFASCQSRIHTHTLRTAKYLWFKFRIPIIMAEGEDLLKGTSLHWGDILVIVAYFVIVIATGLLVSTSMGDQCRWVEL